MNLLSDVYLVVGCILVTLISVALVASAFLPREKRKVLRDYLLGKWNRMA